MAALAWQLRRFAWSALPVVLAAVVLTTGSTAGSATKAPRIVSAAMRDLDGDARADEVVLVYSANVRHATDRDGHFPFAVVGYRIRAVGPAKGKTVTILLREQHQPDPQAHPAIRYRRTTSQPVLGASRTQAVSQLFRRTRAEGPAPPKPPPTTTAPPAAPAAPADSDGDGTPDGQDCGPHDASIHPGASDAPDLSFVDSNCDGIDGTVNDAVFVSPNGKDTNPGTKDTPKRQIQAAVLAATAGGKKSVYAAAGSYYRVAAAAGVGIYGGYDPGNWSHRSSKLTTTIAGSPDGVFAEGTKGVLLQLLTVDGISVGAGASAYGIRATYGAEVSLQEVTVVAAAGAPGMPGAGGPIAADGQRGGDGQPGACDTFGVDNSGGEGGLGGSLRGGADGAGGRGGDGGFQQSNDGIDGSPGARSQLAPGAVDPDPAAAGGKGGAAGDPGAAGRNGQTGKYGRNGGGGSGGFMFLDGGDGAPGQAGYGGGGGGGGGAQAGPLVRDGAGNAGGGGGGGGGGGIRGLRGTHGGGSFGVYLLDSRVTVDSSSITAGNGGAGGAGGAGGPGGNGGPGGSGARACLSEIGAGGNGGGGGHGGQGGGGGGGGGGPSIGIWRLGTSTATVKGSTIKFGTGGAGGAAGAPNGARGQAGIAEKGT